MYLREYIQKYKDEVLTADTFNHPDGALLSMFTLTDIEGIVPKNKPVKFKDAMEKQIELHKMKKMGLLLPLQLTKALYEASLVKRYRGIKVHDYFNLIDEDEVTQSTFVQMDLKDGVTIVIFAGTDDTLVGWKENFNIVYGGHVPCLKHALDYANNLTPDRKYIFIGHSKGGMECLYAGLLCRKEIQDCIISINDYDGTGYHPNVLKDFEGNPNFSKANLIVPNACSVGRFFFHPIEHKILYSNEVGLMQHNPLSWRIKGHDFDYVDSFLANSENLPNMVTSTGDKFSVPELQEFEKAMFETLGAGGSKKLIEIPARLFDVNKAFLTMSLKNKSLYLKFMKHLIDGKLITYEMIRQDAKVKWNPFSKTK